jgi:NAD(P)-dependent dehydrogenase (short-subunit alcohol dehydrogenase family)
MQIRDHVFIVTGASSGIGLATAIDLTERGAKVALLARSGDARQELAQKLPGSLPVTVDMTQFDRVLGSRRRRSPALRPYRRSHQQCGAQLCGLRPGDRARAF